MPNTQIARLKLLRDKAFPLAEKALEDGLLDFNEWTSDGSCGTAHCLLGWFCTMPEAQADGWYLEYDENPAWRVDVGLNAAREYFGLDGTEALIFGAQRHPSKGDDLDARLTRVSQIISDLEYEEAEARSEQIEDHIRGEGRP